MATESYRPKYVGEADEETKEVLIPRHSGRKNEEMRPMHIQTGVIHCASGSGLVTLGKTHVIGAVYGPSPQRGAYKDHGVLKIDVSMAGFATHRSLDLESGSRVAKKMGRIHSASIQAALDGLILLEKYPKAEINIQLKILEDDGSALSALITAASLALADAGIEMRDVIPAVSVCMVPQSGGETDRSSYLLDPDGVEERSLPAESGVLDVALAHRHGTLAFLQSSGPLTPRQMDQMLQLAMDAARSVGEEMRRCLEDGHRAKKRKAEHMLSDVN